MIYEALVVIGAPVFRSVLGWLNSAIEDGAISEYEWRQLLQTVLRVGVPAVVLFYGLNLDAEMAAAIPLLADLVFSEIKKVVDRIKAK